MLPSMAAGMDGVLVAYIWLQTGDRNKTNATDRHVRTNGSSKCNCTYKFWPHWFIKFNICVACPQVFNVPSYA